jgi:GNAT superfamily N-acetyltransferase
MRFSPGGFAARIEEGNDACLRIRIRLFVDGAWRRRGIGLRRLEVLELELRARGCCVWVGPGRQRPAVPKACSERSFTATRI